MTVPYEDDTPSLDPSEPNETDPIHKTSNLEHGGDVWVKIMSWIIGGGLAVVILMLIAALVIYLGKHLF